jgi:epoxyqueuosine reductase
MMERVTDIVDEIREERSLDALAIFPLPDLAGPGENGSGTAPATSEYPLDHTLRVMERGFVPGRYRWTPDKTRRAYRYKTYGGWAKSAVAVGLYYFTEEEYPDDPGYGRISRYTWRDNYTILVGLLEEIAGELEKRVGRPFRHKSLSNYTSIPEKVLGACAGIGDPGSHCVLINENMGTRFVLGEMFTDVELTTRAAVPPLRSPDFAYCGGCTRCIDECPTAAIRERGVLDITRCIQYLSENLLLVPPEARDSWGNRLYGCSLCTDVCPANHGLTPGSRKHGTGYVGQGMDLIRFLDMTEGELHARFGGNQIGRRRFEAVMKNAIIACGSVGYGGAAERLSGFLHHPEPLLRAHAAWSLGRLGKKAVLERRLPREDDGTVLREINAALNHS